MSLIPVFGLIIALGAGIAWYERAQADSFEQGETAAVAKAAIKANADLRVTQAITARLSTELETTRREGAEAATEASKAAQGRVQKLESRVAELQAKTPPECPAPCGTFCYLLGEDDP